MPDKKVEAVKAATPEQLKELAKRLIDTRRNVYREAESILGRKVGDEIFAQLEKAENIFRCDECSTWLPRNLQSDFTDICQQCAEENDSGDEDY